MKVKIKRIDDSLPLPAYETGGAVAFDFISRETTEIDSKGIGRVPSNLVIGIPEGFMLLIKDRSSTAKKKRLLITAGVIDQDFCGDSDEILVQFYNPTDEKIIVERGERLAQGIFIKIDRAEWEEVDQIKAENRGGFGTTDSKTPQL